MERIHPLIPGAQVGERDKAALNLQEPRGVERKENGAKEVHFPDWENDDPNAIIRENKS